ncbi:energy-coupling factor transporter ATPase [Ammoniphilus sp. YIM 78166]|uniref:energy-coupling factor transporter ATPase n=1 Tax=Ammoniphilus sp. YIM 78166 TaxID=1644106 RepID=UPI00106F45C8|nr:energy-coupling factor transporter ATPase [Ammoniphilus sp. YIM 78166]
MDLIVKNLTHVYGKGTPFERQALQPINLHIPTRSFTAIIGQTGSGKSTLVQHFNGLLRPTTGEVHVGKTVITNNRKQNLRELRRKVGLVFQYPEYQLFEETVEKDIQYGPLNFDLPEDLIRARVKDAMKLVDLDYEVFKDLSPFALSGGQKRRVALAGVLVLQPQVLVLDEPTAGLDPHGKKEILQRLYRMHQQEDWTTILVTHNMEDAARYADQIIVMKDGGVYLQGTPAEVFQQGAAIQEVGLDLPDITQFILQLNEKLDQPLPTNIFTMEQLEQELMKRRKVAKR